MKNLFQQLTETPMFKKNELSGGTEIFIPTGLVYSDQTSIDFDLIRRNETNILTDNGRTLSYLDKVFELTEPDVIKNIRAVTEHNGINMTKQRMAVEIVTVDDYIEKYPKMIFTANFMDRMKMFYV